MSKRKLLFGIVCAAALALLIGLLVALKNVSSGTKIGNKRFVLETASTEQQRQHGLSDRDYIASNSGMIFVFDTADNRCMWMKDMRFNLDMLWLDEQGKVVDIKKNLAPSTYPESFCATAKYVIELNAGMVDSAGVRTGHSINL